MTLSDNKQTNYLDEWEEKILFLVEGQAIRAMVVTYEEYMESSREEYAERLNCALPATTEDLVKLTKLPTSTISNIMMKLRRQKKIKSRKVQWFTRELRLYIPYYLSWPDYLFETCGSCENWNRFTSSCTFLQELASDGYQTDKVRLLAKLPPDMLACKWRIPRIKRALKTFRTIQDFAAKAGDTELWFDSNERDSYYLTSPIEAMVGYRCLSCKKPMINLGWGMLPNIGSALLICNYCGSFYKLFFNKNEQVYEVKVAKEKYHEYSKNYQIYTGGDKPQMFEESGKYGFSLASISKEDLHEDILMLTPHNLYGHYNQLRFLVVNTEEEVELLKREVCVNFPRIEIIQREKQLESIEPTKQQLGAVGLLRETEVLNIDYALALLRSRRNALEQITEYSDKKLLNRAHEEISKKINELLERKKQGKLLGSKEWNRADGLVANYQWEVLKKIFVEKKFGFPNRRKARHTEGDPIRPYGRYFSFSSGNTVVNAMFRKIDTEFIKKCIDHQFPWDGLPGICHRKTTGGSYGFLLDNEEAFKQATLPAVIKAVVEEKVTPDMVSSKRLRKRIPQYYLLPGTEGDTELDEECKQLMKSSVFSWMNGKKQKNSIEKTMDYQVLSLKQFVNDIIWNEKLLITNKRKQYSAWTVGDKRRWGKLSRKEQQRIREAIKAVMHQAKGYFQPYQFQVERDAQEFNFEL